MPLVQTSINIYHYSEIFLLLFTYMAFSQNSKFKLYNIVLQVNSSPNTVHYFPFLVGSWEWKFKSWACEASTISLIYISPGVYFRFPEPMLKKIAWQVGQSPLIPTLWK